MRVTGNHVYAAGILVALLASCGSYAILRARACERAGGVLAVGVFRLHCVEPLRAERPR